MFCIKEKLNKMIPAVKCQLKGLTTSNASSVHPRQPVDSSTRAQTNFSRHRSFAESSLKAIIEEQEIVIALGSNVGDRINNFNTALKLMKDSGISITRHACLYETAPAHVTDQPLFLNSAVRGTTMLGPHELLRQLKHIEKDLGRTDGIRFGPRPIDLDIILYGKHQINSDVLTIPHERIHERPFVMVPLVDLLGSSTETDIDASWHSLTQGSDGLFKLWENLGGESLIGKEDLKRVLPVGGELLDFAKRTQIMSILNLTPDGFRDGGKFQDVEAAVNQVKLLLSEGADIIDIGAQSTRLFARRLSAGEELQRLVPVFDAVTKMPEIKGKLLSVDTFYAEVAAEAVSRGIRMVNDVSGGHLDHKILEVVSELGIPYIIMHMRGDPSTMQSDQNLQYDDVCKQVASELYSRVCTAELAGIPLWRMIVDPGIGFSKDSEQNLQLLAGLSSIRREMGKRSIGASHVPMLVGPSRKRFLGEICGRANPVERDPPTVAATTSAILGGANIVRVHKARFGVDTAKICDALLRQRNTRKFVSQ